MRSSKKKGGGRPRGERNFCLTVGRVENLQKLDGMNSPLGKRKKGGGRGGGFRFLGGGKGKRPPVC